MARRTRLAVSAAAALLVWAAAAAVVRASDQPAPPVADEVGRSRLLDVPYLPQTEDLCGGAAMAMVLRYWGERQVYPEDFAGLVDRGASGIRTDVLAAEVSRRGWRPFSLNANPDANASGEWIRQNVDRGRPIVALIQVRPNRYHYVVIVAWTGEQVVAHDPARGPFHVMSRAEFDRAWAPAGRWALLILPSDDRPLDAEAPVNTTTIDTHLATGTCASLIQDLVDLARKGEAADAETGLLAAVQLCPRHPAAWRALAGVRFLQSRWAEASALSERAALLEPDDEQGWDLLATSRFLNDEADAALDAWNRIGRPSVDVIRVEGARRTRPAVVVDLVGLAPRERLTAERRRRAARRLEELPSASLTRLRYRPVDGGLAEIEAVVVERPILPRGVVPIAAAAARAVFQRELTLNVASPVGDGELWTAAWRWWEARPRLAFGLSVPAVSWLPGVATIEGFWERPSYEIPSAERSETASIFTLERRRAGLSLADWATDSLRWKAGAALDRWAEGSHLSVDGALDLRFAGDRVSVGIDTAAWLRVRSGGRFARGGVSYAWRSTSDSERPSWLVQADLTATSAAAPFDLWPGAGTGHARTPLLRAHPLLDAGVVSGPAFGRRLAQGTVEYQHPLLFAPWGAVRLAAFSDTARAWHRIGGAARGPLHSDVGAGIRIGLPGNGGTVRVDVARGLRDGPAVLSAGWQAPWPGR